MPTLVLGNKRAVPVNVSKKVKGFTLLELMVVVAIIAIAVAVVTLALPNPAALRLEKEASRLIALLESARAEARASGTTVVWTPKTDGNEADGNEQDYEFTGLPVAAIPSLVWMDREVKAEVLDAKSIVLGPEPIIEPQRVMLMLEDQKTVIATDGLSAFAKELSEATTSISEVTR